MRRVRVAATGAVRRRAIAFEREDRARTCRISAVVTLSRARQALPPMIRGSLALSELSSGLSAQSTSTTLAGQTCRVDRASPGTKQEHGHVETGVVDSCSRRGRRRVVGDVGCPAAGAARGRRRHRRGRHRWHGDERAGARGRRVGDCRDHGYAHEAPQDRRDRRPWPLPPARPADQGQLQRLGPRIRPGRFGARAGHAGEKPGVDGARGA